jgi:hypothetical protein
MAHGAIESYERTQCGNALLDAASAIDFDDHSHASRRLTEVPANRAVIVPSRIGAARIAGFLLHTGRANMVMVPAATVAGTSAHRRRRDMLIVRRSVMRMPQRADEQVGRLQGDRQQNHQSSTAAQHERIVSQFRRTSDS